MSPVCGIFLLVMLVVMVVFSLVVAGSGRVNTGNEGGYSKNHRPNCMPFWDILVMKVSGTLTVVSVVIYNILQDFSSFNKVKLVTYYFDGGSCCGDFFLLQLCCC